MSGWDDDDAIGYGKPPRYTQFRKGRSGNPAGRPRKAKLDKSVEASSEVPQSTEHDDVLRKLYNEKVAVTSNGKKQKLTVFEVVAKRQVKDAANGSVTAQREIRRAKEQLDERDAARVDAQQKREREAVAARKKEDLDLYWYLVELHQTQSEAYRLQRETGVEPKRRYPHPDDLEFDHVRKRAKINGPFDEEGARVYVRPAKQRDYHLLDYVILCRQRPQGSKVKKAVAIVAVGAFDALLPKRKQLIDDSLDTVLWLLYALPMRDLREWRREVKSWLACYPVPELTKKERTEIYRSTNAAMKPILKQMGFRSVAELERHCEMEEERERKAS